MKLKLLGLAAALFIAQISMAQFHIGVKGGANLTKIEGKTFKEEFKYGYHVGAFAEIGLGGRFTLQPEVIFNQYTTTLDSNFHAIYENVIASDQSKVKLRYLSVPILLDYKLLGPIHIQAGPQVGILMAQDKNFLENGRDAFKDGDCSMLAGAQIHLGTLRLTGRYIVGLNNINDIDNQDKWKNQAIQLSVGLAF